MSKSITLLRGLPGSGKSTFARNIAWPSWPIVSADDFFMKNGKYIFDAKKLHIAHKYSQETVETFMIQGCNKIFVANTFTTEKEMNPYFELAKKYDYEIFSIIVENRHGNNSIHNVPDTTITSMKERFNIKL